MMSHWVRMHSVISIFFYKNGICHILSPVYICQHFHPPVDMFINTSCSKQYLQDKYRNYVSKSFTVLFLFNYNNIIDYKCFEIHNEMLCNFAFQKRTHQRMSNIYVLNRTNFSIQYQH